MTVTIDGTNGITTPSPVVVQGSTSGTITLAAPAVAGSNTQTLVATTGTLAPIVSGTAVASTSGTSIDFTSIPSWVKRITVMFNGVSGSGTSPFQIQLGDSGGFETTGYASGAGSVGTSSAAGGASTTGLLLQQAGVAAATVSGLAIITNISGNTWVCASTFGTPSNGGNFGGGTKTLSDTLTQVRITTVNGTDTFDAGSINILYE